jgi:pilus assembly protein CpaE
VEVVGLVESLGNGSSSEQFDANLLVVACGGYSDEVLGYIESEVKASPGRPVVVVCSGHANGFVRRVFEAGADDIVVVAGNGAQPDSAVEDVLFTFQKAVARRNGARAESGGAKGRMICVLGPKGGIGKTLTTVNLAVSLADEGQRVVVVDLDLQFGDCGLALGLEPKKTIYDLVTSGGAMDAEKIDAYLAEHESGVRVLLAPMRPDQAGAVTVEFLRDLYTALRFANDFVIVDTPPGFTPEVIASVDSSTHVCMVGTLDSLSLKNTKLGLETLELMGYEGERINLVLNRADSHVGITHDDVRMVVGREPDVLVPSHRDIARTANMGAPIVTAARRSEASKAFRSLAEFYRNGTPGNGVANTKAVAKANGRSRRLRLRRKG